MAQYHVRSITDKDGNKFLVTRSDPRYWNDNGRVPLQWFNEEHTFDPTTQYALSYYGKWIVDKFIFRDIITETDKSIIKDMLSNAASKAASTTSRSFDKDIAIDVAQIMINELEDSKYDKNKLSNNLREVLQMLKQPFITYPQSLKINQLDVINKYQAIAHAIKPDLNDENYDKNDDCHNVELAGN